MFGTWPDDWQKNFRSHPKALFGRAFSYHDSGHYACLTEGDELQTFTNYCLDQSSTRSYDQYTLGAVIPFDVL